MRSGPAPALHDVLVTRPGSAPSTAMVRRDDLLAAAVRAAEDAAPAPRPAARPRSVLARVTRRWARLSDSLRRRRASQAATASAAAAAAALAAADTRHARDSRVELVAAFDRERAVRAAALAEREGRLEEELAVCSLRETSTRRVRQVGAREDDDTLLMLPRVASISFSTPDSRGDAGSGALARDNAPRVRQLPRVSALMPMRAPRPLAVASPVSSADGAGGSDGDTSDGDGSLSEGYDSEQAFSDRAEDDVDDDIAVHRHALHRLPTGMSNMDVEREMERAVVEIASDGDSDSSSVPGEMPVEGGGDGKEGEEQAEAGEQEPPGEGRGATATAVDAVARSRSETHRGIPLPSREESQIIAAFSRRVSSSTHSQRRLLPEEEGEARPLLTAEQKSRFQGSKDFALFEDDYLSFQGFHGQPESRSHYQSMSSLLRSKRISSVTDSHSEDSDEAAAVKAVGHTDSRRKQTRRSPLLPSMLRFKRGLVVDSADS